MAIRNLATYERIWCTLLGLSSRCVIARWYVVLQSSEKLSKAFKLDTEWNTFIDLTVLGVNVNFHTITSSIMFKISCLIYNSFAGRDPLVQNGEHPAYRRAAANRSSSPASRTAPPPPPRQKTTKNIPALAPTAPPPPMTRR